MSTPTVPPAGAKAVTTGLRSVYQPIVDLRNGSVVAYEALVRGPDGGEFEQPDPLFAAAREQGFTAELDWACRAAAFDGALAAGLSAPSTLFVNVEPDAVDAPCPPQFLNTMVRAREGVRAVFEVTERALANKPAELLRVVEEIRAQGWGIALDDVGADWRSLALMPFIRPDVIKLDMHLVPAQYRRLFAALGTPLTWSQGFDFTTDSVTFDGTRKFYHLRGVARDASTGVASVLLDVPDDHLDAMRARWTCADGTLINERVYPGMDGTYDLPRRAEIETTAQGFHVYADLEYGDYALNEGFPDSVFSGS